MPTMRTCACAHAHDCRLSTVSTAVQPAARPGPGRKEPPSKRGFVLCSQPQPTAATHLHVLHRVPYRRHPPVPCPHVPILRLICYSSLSAVRLRRAPPSALRAPFPPRPTRSQTRQLVPYTNMTLPPSPHCFSITVHPQNNKRHPVTVTQLLLPPGKPDLKRSTAMRGSECPFTTASSRRAHSRQPLHGVSIHDRLLTACPFKTDSSRQPLHAMPLHGMPLHGMPLRAVPSPPPTPAVACRHDRLPPLSPQTPKTHAALPFSPPPHVPGTPRRAPTAPTLASDGRVRNKHLRHAPPRSCPRHVIPASPPPPLFSCPRALAHPLAPRSWPYPLPPPPPRLP